MPLLTVRTFEERPSRLSKRLKPKPVEALCRWAVRQFVAATGIMSVGLAGCSSPTPDPTSPQSYVPLCATAMTKVQFDAHILDGATLTPNEPGIVSRGPPVRVMCGVMVPGNEVGVVTFDAKCDDASDKACADVISIDVNGRRISGPIS